VSNVSIGLALSGGGARGAAHIGVLQVFQQSGIHVEAVAGTSAGAVIGAMYAATQDPDWVEQRFREFLVSEPFANLGTGKISSEKDPHSAFGQIAKKVKDQIVLAMSLHRASIIKKERLQAAFEFLIPVATFEELQIPLMVVATDIQTCEPCVYSEGNLIEAVVQSGTIPGYVQPTITEDKVLVDGGVSMPNPTPVLKPLMDFVVAVDLRKQKLPHLPEVNIYEVLMRSDQVTYIELSKRLVALADFVIEPEIDNIHWSQFEKFDDLLQAGIKAAEASIPDLKSKLKGEKPWWMRWKQWFGLNP